MIDLKTCVDFDALKTRSTLEIDKVFYETCAAPKLKEAFPFYERRIAVGLVGEGSECFGYDDAISRDHDFELGFCMWVTRPVYDAIGSELQSFYLDLMQNEGAQFSELVWGRDVSFVKERVAGRRGVMEISSFYSNILRLNADVNRLLEQNYWMYAEPRFLATATNGEVFRDDEGVFSRVRNAILDYYPERTYLFKLAEQLHLFSHGGQSNYPRMMARKDHVTARICIDHTIESAMQIAYLLARRYPPYYKWTRRGLDELPILKDLGQLLEELVLLPVQTAAWEDYTYSSASVNMKDQVIVKIEEIASLLADELYSRGFISHKENFLESHVQELAARAQRA